MPTKEARYTLEDYQFAVSKGRRQKHICPSCGKRTFVRYIDEEGNYIGNDVGRCDREVKCGYHKKPSGKTTLKTKYMEKKKETLIIEQSIVQSTLKKRESDNLYKYLCSKFDKQKVDEVFDRYFVGADKLGRCVFWQIDLLGKVRTGKMIGYDENGKRLKDEKAYSWVHCYIDYDKEKYEMKQVPFFGIHLLNQRKYKKLFIVESEKTALVMAIIDKREDVLWLATGGKLLFNDYKLMWLFEVSNQTDIAVLPDEDAWNDWIKIVRSLSNPRIYDVEWMSEYEGVNEGDDIADAVLNGYKRVQKNKPSESAENTNVSQDGDEKTFYMFDYDGLNLMVEKEKIKGDLSGYLTIKMDNDYYLVEKKSMIKLEKQNQ